MKLLELKMRSEGPNKTSGVFYPVKADERNFWNLLLCEEAI